MGDEEQGVKQQCRFALGLVLLGVSTYAIAQQFDLLSANCLIGYENDENPEICAVVHPATKDDVIEARRKWRTRNATALAELQAACQARLLRAYGNEQAIREAKEQARQVNAYQRELFLRDPNRSNRVNCRAYAKDFAEGGPRIDIRRELIEETRDSAAQRVEWPNQALQGAPAGGRP